MIRSILLLSFLNLTVVHAEPEQEPEQVATLAESQQKWVKFYKKQNIPNPGEMLINTDKEPSLDQEFIDLYNGQDLSHWQQYGGAHSFEATPEYIEGTCVKGQASAYLCTKVNYTNFIFTGEIRWIKDMNTGFLFRSKARTVTNKKEKIVTEAFGPQVEMEGFKKPDRGWSGGLYRQGCGGWTYPLWLEQHEEARNALEAEGWNRVTILAEGETVKTWINGVPAANWVDPEFFEGFIGLQVHSGGSGKVQFRNLKIKTL